MAARRRPRRLQQLCRAMSAVHVGTADRFIPKNPDFQARHIGPRDTDQQAMLNTLGFQVWRNGKTGRKLTN